MHQNTIQVSVENADVKDIIKPLFFQDWDVAENIPDPDAKKPDDWDDEMDGEWEPPMVTNPDYKVSLHGRLN